MKRQREEEEPEENARKRSVVTIVDLSDSAMSNIKSFMERPIALSLTCKVLYRKSVAERLEEECKRSVALLGDNTVSVHKLLTHCHAVARCQQGKYKEGLKKNAPWETWLFAKDDYKKKKLRDRCPE